MAETELDESMRRVLELYQSMEAEKLDLHTLFEAGGNDPRAREAVLDAVASLVKAGYLEARGGDYYALTEAGRELIR